MPREHFMQRFHAFHAFLSMKDRNSMNLTEAEDIKKRWKNTQKNYKKKILATWLIMMV